MIYLLDTNAVIGLLNDMPRTIRQRFRTAATAGASIFISSIVLFGLEHGVAKSQKDWNSA